jgi:DNA (cytosine-5)-methyltransferase 1
VTPSDRDAIPVIDLFAGPGGLGEGFAAALPASAGRGTARRRAFRIALSIEKDAVAHRTLLLRAFYRQFPPGLAPDAYYHYLQRRPGSSREALFAACPRQAEAATPVKELAITLDTSLGSAHLNDGGR